MPDSGTVGKRKERAQGDTFQLHQLEIKEKFEVNGVDKPTNVPFLNSLKQDKKKKNTGAVLFSNFHLCSSCAHPAVLVSKIVLPINASVPATNAQKEEETGCSSTPCTHNVTVN